MPELLNRDPAYRLHKPSGQARVRIGGMKRSGRGRSLDSRNDRAALPAYPATLLIASSRDSSKTGLGK